MIKPRFCPAAPHQQAAIKKPHAGQKRRPSRVLRQAAFVLFLVVFLSAFSGCIGASTPGFNPDGSPQFSDPNYQRTPPALALSGYTGENQLTRENPTTGDSGVIDLSNLSKGYVAVSCASTQKVVFQVRNGDQKYDYFFTNTGEFVVFPLAMGNGTYTFTILVNTQGSEYYFLLNTEAQVTLESEQAPFLVPNQQVHYDENSECVRLSYELAQHAVNDLEVVQQVYYWVRTNITYDYARAEEVQKVSGYLPLPDRVIEEKKGICYDYASLVAAMLRANGIPCQLAMGYVYQEGGNLYHAWNLIWTDETGWIAIKVPSTPEEWKRMDLTFAASPDDSIVDFIEESANYTETSFH